MFLKATSDFPYMNTIAAALIGAIIGQLIIVLVNWAKKKIDLKNKKRLIQADISNQKIILERMEIKLNELKILFETNNTDIYKGDVFHDITKDIYESVSKIDLYKIFGKKLPILVDIYESLMFLKANNPPEIYNRYVTKLNNHITEKQDDPKHDFYCRTHMGFIKIAIDQISNNLSTISDIKEQMIKLDS
jgi:hypothetical protein